VARASVVVVCSEACAIKQSPLGGACDSTGVDPATGECVLDHQSGAKIRLFCKSEIWVRKSLIRAT
jgi:hypothetical protein